VIEQTEREIGNAQDKARLAKDARSRVGRRHALGEKSNEQTEFGRAAKAGQGGVWRLSPYTGRPALPQIEASAVPLLLTLCLVGCILVAFAALAHYGASHVRWRSPLLTTRTLGGQDVDFSPCHGPMLNPFGHDKNLAGTECDRAIPQLDVECSFEDKKKIVCLVMFVPVERSFKLRYHRGTNWHSRHEGRRC
jgi:hypothetical protein